MPPSPAVQQRRRRGLIAALLSLVLMALGLWRLTHSSVPAGPPAAAPAPTPIPFVAVAGTPLTATTVLGAGAGLVAPHDAVYLLGGRIAVADTGNARLALLDARGHLLTSVRSGATALQEPYAVAATAHVLYVLDAGRGAIERYDLAGHFQREILQRSILGSARGLAVGPGGTLYVASPATNSVDVLSPTGQLLHQFTSPALGSGADQYNQPSDVAVGANGTIYVLDNVNDRIKAITPTGRFLTQWPAPGSDTLHSVHVLPLPDGRLLASDPFGGALLVYPPGPGVPARLPLAVPGQPAAHIQPLGLALTPTGAVLVSDGVGNRLLVVPAPKL